MYELNYSDLDRDNIEVTLDLILCPLFKSYYVSSDKRLPKTSDDKIDACLDRLITWVESLNFALEYLGCLENREQRDSPLKEGEILEPRDLELDFEALSILENILQALRRCQSNIYLDRVSRKGRRGKPDDGHRYKYFKGEVGRMYRYLVLIGASSDQACEIINTALHSLKVPLMSKSCIQKLSYKNKGYPALLLREDNIPEDQKHRYKDGYLVDHEFHYEYSQVMCIFGLQPFARDLYIEFGN